MATNTYTPNLNLNRLIDAGSITIDDDEIVGHAADGCEVTIGYTFNLDGAEAYLAQHPTPDTW